MSANRFILNLSPEFKTFIEWCENPENMPEFESNDSIVEDNSLICPISLSLPKIPVNFLGHMYDLTSISSADPENKNQRILRVSEEPLSRTKINNPDNEIKPTSIEFRERISRERKKLSGSLDRHLSNPARLFSQSTPMEQAITAIKENRIEKAQELLIQHKLNADILGEMAACAGVPHFAKYLLRQGANIQSLLNGALAGGHVKFAEELTLMAIDTRTQFDFSFALIHAARQNRFTDDESCMRLLVEFEDIRIRSSLIRIFKEYGPFLRMTDLGFVAKDFHDRLNFIYIHMDNHKSGFDAAYKAMLEKFDGTEPTTSLRR